MDREAVDEINAHFDLLMGELRKDIQDLARGVDALRDEMHDAFEALREEFRSTRRELAANLRAAVDK
jgi:hypothetical protein